MSAAREFSWSTNEKCLSICIGRGSLLSREGNVNTYIGRRVKDSLKVLHVFRKDNTQQTSGLPHPDMESWKKEIGERLRYSSAELRKSVDQAKLESSRFGCR